MIAPYGGVLVDLLVDSDRAAEMKATAKDLASVTLDDRGVCDLELLSVGAYSPLKSFLGKADYDRVVAERRLADGTFWPSPITLPVVPGPGIAVGETLALRDVYGNLLAFLHVEELYQPAEKSDSRVGDHNVSGRLEVIRTPPHYDFIGHRRTPADLRACFDSLGWTRVVACQPSSLMNRADEERTKRAAMQIGGGLLIHPAVGVAKPGDQDHYTRIRCLRAMVEEGYQPNSVLLNLLPSDLRGADSREFLLSLILQRNYGCTHLLVDFAAEAGDQQTHAEAHDEIGVRLVDLKRFVYLPEENRYELVDDVPQGARTADLSEAQVHDDYLALGRPLPEWFCRPAVAGILHEANPPRYRQGLTIWFTGLSGSGKSTVAQGLAARLAEYGRNCSLLDGDEIRTHLAKGLGFSKEDRDANVRRVGYVAGMVARHGGTTLCSVISPYQAPRAEARQASNGNFVEIYCETPVEICEQRDVKGFYAQARAALADGKPMGFTGVDDPYEIPVNPEVTLDTSQHGVSECVDMIIDKLSSLGYLAPHPSTSS